jgi:hypothetical protein
VFDSRWVLILGTYSSVVERSIAVVFFSIVPYHIVLAVLASLFVVVWEVAGG